MSITSCHRIRSSSRTIPIVTSYSVTPCSAAHKKTFSKVRLCLAADASRSHISIDFYFELGSRRLSSLVKDEYKTSSEVKHTRKAAEVRTLILERLPLFLHEHTHTQTRVPFSWLNQDQNFVVRAFGKLTVVKSLLYDQRRIVKNQDASAIAFRDGRGPIQLWLAGNDQVDMYEVSTSLCRLLFEHPRASDALLFMTILSTDLRALRRRGYNGSFVHTLHTYVANTCDS